MNDPGRDDDEAGLDEPSGMYTRPASVGAPVPSLRPKISGQYHAVAAGAYTSALRPREAPSLEPPSVPSNDRVLGRLAELVTTLGPASTCNEVVEAYAALLVELLPRRLVAIRRIEDLHIDDTDGIGEWAERPARETAFLDALDGIDVVITRAGRTVAVVAIETDEPDPQDLAQDAQVVRSVGPFLAASLEAAERTRLRAGEADVLRAQVIRADKLATIGQFAAEVVHELNNPLSAIIAYADGMVRRPDRDATDRTRLERIGEAASRIQTLARRLLAYARPGVDADAREFAADLVLEQATQFCEHLAVHSGATLECRIDPGLPRLRGSPSELVQAFVNLITNACNAIEAGRGHVAVSARAVRDGAGVLVVVEDNGHGIEPGDLPRIFEPFFTTRGAAGTGLGLSIVRYILESQSAVCRVRSTPGVGTRFEVELTAVASRR